MFDQVFVAMKLFNNKRTTLINSLALGMSKFKLEFSKGNPYQAHTHVRIPNQEAGVCIFLAFGLTFQLWPRQFAVFLWLCVRVCVCLCASYP